MLLTVLGDYLELLGISKLLIALPSDIQETVLTTSKLLRYLNSSVNTS